jgi:uncharacterized protein with HEPN domain
MDKKNILVRLYQIVNELKDIEVFIKNETDFDYNYLRSAEQNLKRQIEILEVDDEQRQ